MPRYVYECFECGHTLEKIEGWSAPARQPCTECESEFQRIPSPPAIVFKGSGWYSTDNRKSNWKSRADEDRDSDESSNGAESSNGTGDSTTSGEKETAASTAD